MNSPERFELHYQTLQLNILSPKIPLTPNLTHIALLMLWAHSSFHTHVSRAFIPRSAQGLQRKESQNEGVGTHKMQRVRADFIASHCIAFISHRIAFNLADSFVEPLLSPKQRYPHPLQVIECVEVQEAEAET
jgi:hypothetical protein